MGRAGTTESEWRERREQDQELSPEDLQQGDREEAAMDTEEVPPVGRLRVR